MIIFPSSQTTSHIHNGRTHLSPWSHRQVLSIKLEYLTLTSIRPYRLRFLQRSLRGRTQVDSLRAKSSQATFRDQQQRKCHCHQRHLRRYGRPSQSDRKWRHNLCFVCWAHSQLQRHSMSLYLILPQLVPLSSGVNCV